MKFKDGAKIETSEFWYDLIEGGYIDPEKVLENEDDAKRVRFAIQVLTEFYDEAEEQDVLELL